MNALENKLCNIYNSKYAYFTGNATTGLYLILKSLDLKNRKVLFPDITCMAPVNAAVYAGYIPLFCDVNLSDYTMNVKSLNKILEEENIGIVVPTHIYGHICDTKEIYSICKKKNIIVIEDAAQTIGISEYSDFAITSFGHTKIIESEIGGGAIFYKDIEFKDKFEKYAKGLKSINDKELSSNYAKEYYRIAKTLKGDQYYNEMKELQYNSKEVFLGHFNHNLELSNILDNKNYILKLRYERALIYFKKLDKEFFELPKINIEKENPLWRITVNVKNINRDEFVNEVRKNDIDISTWYPNLHNFYSSQDDKIFKNSIYLSKSLVNLWVTEKYSLEKIKHDIDIINKIARRIKYE